MRWLFYNILFHIGFLLMLPRFFLRMKRRGGYVRDFGNRIGVYRKHVAEALTRGERIWVHAVSVGEVRVGLQFMAVYRAKHAHAQFVVSTTTPTGYRILQEEVGHPDLSIYFPIDSPWVVARVLNRISLRALVLIEGEFWPNLVRQAFRRGVAVYLINGRISANSYRGYRKLRIFTRHLFPLFECLCVQGSKDRDRLIDLGAPVERIRVLNSVKYESVALDPEGAERAGQIMEWAGLDRGRPCLLGASTWPGEEAILLDIYDRMKESHPGLCLVLVPRHAERSGDVAAEIEERGLRWIRRSECVPPGNGSEPADIFLVDTTGELTHFYPHATVIFVGKSLRAKGGQNVIEPAWAVKPILVGPHMENFSVIIEEFLEAEAIVQVENVGALFQAVVELFDDPGKRDAMGQNALRLVGEKSGALSETVRIMESRLEGLPRSGQ